MKVKELMAQLKACNQEADIVFSSDEELNILRTDGEVAALNKEGTKYAIYGFDGTEED